MLSNQYRYEEPMAAVEHKVSYRNGSQIMVAGLKLARLGYRRGARVSVQDPMGRPENPSWEFVVANDEHATLVCRDPLPPSWIVPGTLIRIEVTEPMGDRASDSSNVTAHVPRPPSQHPPVVTATMLADWRRSLVQLLSRLEGARSEDSTRGVAARIARLSEAGRVPREIAALMRVVSEMRNVSEYQGKALSPAEAEAVSAAWRAVSRWAATAAEAKGSAGPRR
jgi:hypothetical protein